MKRPPDIVKEIDATNPLLFTQLDKQFGDFMARLAGSYTPELVLAARLVSNHISKGSVCVHIPSVAGKNIYSILNENSNTDGIYLYDEDEWHTKLKKSDVIGRPGDVKPLILDDNGRLYLYRYWLYEYKLAENIKKRLTAVFDIDTSVLKKSMTKLFKSEDDVNQQIAAIGACLSGFCVITGGPGTGKTSLVIKILALLLENTKDGHLKIALAAPTGKAAARLSEAVKNVREHIDCSDKVRENIPDESFTIHRLLGSFQGSLNFRYNVNNQLPYDIVVIDESSMADLALTAKLFEAIPLNSRVILLGDKDQLSSVEAGAVIGDICDTGNRHSLSKKFISRLEEILKDNITDKSTDRKKWPSIADSIYTLTKSYRFSDESGIGELSRAIKDGEADKFFNILKSTQFTDISLLNTGTFKSSVMLINSIRLKVINGYSPLIKSKLPKDALNLYSNFTILCALRKGPYGIEQINTLIEKILLKAGLISNNVIWYEGRPVIISRNEYNVKLYNGDLGIMRKDPEDGIVRFFTASPDGTIRKILPSKLPEHETAYALTVHKSQGSEFDNVLLVLPDRISPVLSRELLYTAVTRARKKIEIYGNEDILRYMINNETKRISGLKDSLWNI